jgi:hypothetical protein
VNRRRESIAAEGAHELRVYPRVSFEMVGDVGAGLDFAKEIAERRRAKPVQVLDESLAAEPKPRFVGAARVAFFRLRMRPILLYLLNVNASKQLTSKRITFPASRLGR